MRELFQPQVSEEAIADVLMSAKAGESLASLSRRYGMGESWAGEIVRGRLHPTVRPDLHRRRNGKWVLLQGTSDRRLQHETWVRTCLASASRSINHSRMGRLLGISRQMVTEIRYGRVLANVLPELTRWGAGEPDRSCRDCVFWSGSMEFNQVCDLNLPDAENTSAARQCGSFLERFVQGDRASPEETETTTSNHTRRMVA